MTVADLTAGKPDGKVIAGDMLVCCVLAASAVTIDAIVRVGGVL